MMDHLGPEEKKEGGVRFLSLEVLITAGGQLGLILQQGWGRLTAPFILGTAHSYGSENTLENPWALRRNKPFWSP